MAMTETLLLRRTHACCIEAVSAITCLTHDMLPHHGYAVHAHTHIFLYHNPAYVAGAWRKTNVIPCMIFSSDAAAHSYGSLHKDSQYCSSPAQYADIPSGQTCEAGSCFRPLDKLPLEMQYPKHVLIASHCLTK